MFVPNCTCMSSSTGW